MSSVDDNKMGPVLDATPEIEAIADRPEIKHAAIHKLHELHHNATVHHFEESAKADHISNWKYENARCLQVKLFIIVSFRVIQYAEEDVSYGVNYFLKVVKAGSTS